MNKERQQNILKILDHLKQLHDEDSINYIKLNLPDVTEHLQDVLTAFKIYFTAITQKDVDIIDFIGILNKLAVQFVLEDKEEDEDEGTI